MAWRAWKTLVPLGLLMMFCVAPGQGQSSGRADLSKYVALGDSLAASFSSGGLSVAQQLEGYPALLHGAFQAVGGATAEFEQPLVCAPGIPAQLELRGLGPVVIAPRPGMGVPINLGLPRPYDNLGVPGARVRDTASTVTDNGGAHDLVLRGLGTALQQALALEPTFVSLWIGNNDVLGPATSGLSPIGPPLTTVDDFAADLLRIVEPLAASNAQLAIANLPDVTAIPFFTTIPPIVVNPLTNQPVLDEDGNPIPLIGPDGPLEPGDLVLLTASQLLAQRIGIPVELGGTGLALPDQVVLNEEETEIVLDRVEELNELIADVAADHGAALVDIKTLFDRIAGDEGFTLGGIHYSSDFLTGGLFSYDAVHPTRLGYGVVATAFIDAINDTFDARVPAVNLRSLAFDSPPSHSPPCPPAGSAARPRLAEGTFVYSKAAWRSLRFALGLDRPDLGLEAPGEETTTPVAPPGEPRRGRAAQTRVR